MTSDSKTIELTSWDQVKAGFRSKHLRQAGYTAGAVVMAGTLLDLHGDEHRERRRVENRLFRRETFERWEYEVLGATIEATLRPFIAEGRGDLVQIGYRAAMNLTAKVAGIDVDPADQERTDQLYGIVKKFSEGATLMHSTRDPDVVRAEVAAVVAEFRRDFYEPSLAERVATPQHPANDVLATLLANHARLPLEPEVVFREICFYLQAGAHSTANAFTHTINDIFEWCAATGADPASLDMATVQRCMHESLRLNPASPVAYRTPVEDIELPDGTVLPAGSSVVLNLTAANTDTAVLGETAASFDPNRVLPAGVPPWGMSFGGGTHACIGAPLDGGLEFEEHRPIEDHLFGTVTVVAAAFLAAGGRPDPAHPAQLDPNSTRKHFSAYPIVFYDRHSGQEHPNG